MKQRSKHIIYTDRAQKRAARAEAHDRAEAETRAKQAAERVRIVTSKLLEGLNCGVIVMPGAEVVDFWKGIEEVFGTEQIHRLPADGIIQKPARGSKTYGSEFNEYKAVGDDITSAKVGVLVVDGVRFDDLAGALSYAEIQENTTARRISELIGQRQSASLSTLMIGPGNPRNLATTGVFNTSMQAPITRGLDFRLALMPDGNLTTYIPPGVQAEGTDNPFIGKAAAIPWGTKSY